MGTDRSDRLRRLAGAGDGRVELDPAKLAPWQGDASPLRGTPDGVVAPDGFRGLQQLVEWAISARIPLIARGGGSGLEGGAVPVTGGVVVDLSGWDRILEIAPEERIARVQPGVTPVALERALAPHGLSYPPVPGSRAASTLGGNAATNASGPRSFRYGSARSWVRSIELVDGRAHRWTAGSRVPKSSAGPDLVGLLVGSEGTLGLFGELIVRLTELPERRTGIALPLAAGAPLAAISRRLTQRLGAALSALEYLDAATSEALSRCSGGPPPSPGGTILLEIEGTGPEESAALERLDRESGSLALSGSPLVYPEADRLWSIRGEAGPALESTLGPRLREDVVVPIPRIDELLRSIRDLAAAHRTPLVIFGHLGEGNLHPVFGLDPGSAEADTIRQELAGIGRALGGSVSGEHGIGATKIGEMNRQLGPEALGVLWAMKDRLDPYGILNPSKLLPPRDPEALRRSGASPSVSEGPPAPSE